MVEVGCSSWCSTSHGYNFLLWVGVKFIFCGVLNDIHGLASCYGLDAQVLPQPQTTYVRVLHVLRTLEQCLVMFLP